MSQTFFCNCHITGDLTLQYRTDGIKIDRFGIIYNFLNRQARVVSFRTTFAGAVFLEKNLSVFLNADNIGVVIGDANGCTLRSIIGSDENIENMTCFNTTQFNRNRAEKISKGSGIRVLDA